MVLVFINLRQGIFKGGVGVFEFGVKGFGLVKATGAIRLFDPWL
jgi:hypothetical protein